MIQPYIYFNGNCKEAVEFYAEAFKTEKPTFMKFSDGPPNPEYPVPPEAANMIMHTSLNIGGSTLMFSDAFPGMPMITGNNISLTYITSDLDEINLIFNKLKQGGTVDMELQQTFWSKSFGSLTDKFGVPWQLSHEEAKA